MSVYRDATHYALKNNITVINKYLVKYSVTGSIGSSKAIFLLTESHFLLFEHNKNKLILSIPWKTLNFITADILKLSFGFSLTNKDKIAVNSTENTENKKYTIWSSQSDQKSTEIKFKVIFLLERVLSRTEQSVLKIRDLCETSYLPTPRSPMARFRMWDVLTDTNYKMDLSTYTELHKKIIYSLVFREENLQLNNFPQVEKILPVYLDILKVAPQVRQLRIPMIPSKKIYENVIDLLENNDYLQFLEISGNCQKEFFYIIKAIKDNKNSKISSLSFVNTQFSIEELTLIYSFITNGSNVNALGFHSSVSPEAVDYFYSSFLTPLLCEKLAILNLDKSPGINTGKLFPKVTNISMLSLESCDIELSDVFNCISQGTAIGLKVLNISRCYVKSVPDVNLPQFNKNFQSLVINEVSWPSGTLVPFFQYFFSHFHKALDYEENEENDSNLKSISGPCLYFSNEIAETDEWLDLFDYLEKVDDYCDLVKLGWNGNPVHQNLFNFLKQNNHLSTLMMSGCFSEECPDSINDLCKFISSSSSFSTLIISGNDINHFGKYSADVINSLKEHQSLKDLDISNSYGGDAAISAISSLIESNMQIQMIDFDGVHPEGYISLITLMRSLYQQRHRIKVSFPTTEFSRFKNNKMMPKEIFDEITHLFKIPIMPEGTSQFQPQTFQEDDKNNDGSKKKKSDDDDGIPYVPPSQILTKDYCIFKNYNPPDFPNIISQKQFEEMRKQTRQQKAISSSPRRENDARAKSAITKRNSPKGTNRNLNLDDDEKVWPNSQKVIQEARKNLKPSVQKKDQDSTDSTRSPKSLESYQKVQSPTRNVRKPKTNKTPTKQNSKVIRKNSRRPTRPSKVQEKNEYDDDYDYYPSTSLKKKPLKSNKEVPRNSIINDYNDYDEEEEIDNIISGGKMQKDANKSDNSEVGTSPTVSLNESTYEDEFVFEEKEKSAKSKKPSTSNKRKAPRKTNQNQRKVKNVKKKVARKKRSRSVSPKIEVNEYDYNDQADSENDSEDSLEIIAKNNRKKYNSRKPVKNYSTQGQKNKEKSFKSQPNQSKKQLNQRRKKSVNDKDSYKNEKINQIKNRNVPQPSDQLDDDEEDIFNSQIFNDQIPRVDKYDNSSNWQKYDQEFALNALFTKIKYNKSV